MIIGMEIQQEWSHKCQLSTWARYKERGQLYWAPSLCAMCSLPLLRESGKKILSPFYTAKILPRSQPAVCSSSKAGLLIVCNNRTLQGANQNCQLWVKKIKKESSGRNGRTDNWGWLSCFLIGATCSAQPSFKREAFISAVGGFSVPLWTLGETLALKQK